MKRTLISGCILLAAMAFNGCGGKAETSAAPGATNGIEVTPSRATIEVGKTVQFQGKATASSAGMGTPTWKSSNTSVATVDGNSGLARAVSPGITTVTASAQDGGTQVSGTATLTVTGTLGVQTSSLPQGTAGVAYHATLQAVGGVPPYSWSVTAGSLPAGLSLTSSGQITGTPTSVGTSNFTVQVRDSNGATAAVNGGTMVAAASN